MTTLSCIIVDDERLACELLGVHIAKVPHLQIVAICNNAIEAGHQIEKLTPDILFLDIQMPNLNGLALLRTLNPKPATILTTAYSEYALEGYNHDIIDYLLKPIEFDRFYQAVVKATNYIGKNKLTEDVAFEKPEELNSYIFIKEGNKIVKVNFEEIVYVEALQKYIRIITTTRQIITLMPMHQIEALMPKSIFIRIHRSFIINIEKMESISGNTIKINNQSLPISKGNRVEFMNEIRKKGFGF